MATSDQRLAFPRLLAVTLRVARRQDYAQGDVGEVRRAEEKSLLRASIGRVRDVGIRVGMQSSRDEARLGSEKDLNLDSRAAASRVQCWLRFGRLAAFILDVISNYSMRTVRPAFILSSVSPTSYSDRRRSRLGADKQSRDTFQNQAEQTNKYTPSRGETFLASECRKEFTSCCYILD